jgi:hypothetical protein
VAKTITDELISRIQNLERTDIKAQYLKESFLSKYVGPDTDSASLRRSRAIEKWLSTEVRNHDTNLRLDHLPPDYRILPGIELDKFVEWLRSFIVTTIGDTPPIECLIGTFSGGASTSRSRTKSHPALKFVGKAHVTSEALEWWEVLTSPVGELGPTIPELPLWPRTAIDPVLVPGNVLFTVPKKADIDRCACKEPDINMFMQKGVGGFLRRALLLKGINLNDQSINQRLARIGSIDDSLATLDLVSASDSVASGLIDLVLPPLWSSLLRSLRSPVTFIDGHEHANEMFSSMGNGFTFELESLLFLSISQAVRHFGGYSGVISIYGDDIICPSDMAHDLSFVLSVLGFSVNAEKSHIRGPFRESCGGHFYNGLDVTPFYIRSPIRYLSDLIHVANQLRKWASFDDGINILCPIVEPIWVWLRDQVPEYLWGGRDCSFQYSLVTPDLPRKRLQATKREFGTGIGGYFHWHSVAWRRENPGLVESSTRSEESTFYRIRSSRLTVSFLTQVFISEI